MATDQEREKRQGKLAELRRKRGQLGGQRGRAQADAGGEGGAGEGRGAKLLRALAKRKAGGEGGGGRLGGGGEKGGFDGSRIREALERSGRDLSEFPKLKEAIEQGKIGGGGGGGGGRGGRGGRALGGEGEASGGTLRERLQSGKERIEKALARLDEAEAAKAESADGANGADVTPAEEEPTTKRIAKAADAKPIPAAAKPTARKGRAAK